MEEDNNDLDFDTNMSLKEIKIQMAQARDEQNPDVRDSMLKNSWKNITSLVIKLRSLIPSKVNNNN